MSTVTETADPRLTLLLAIADDEFILGHRHAEWTGWAPYIEEDLAFSSVAQDEMAHARLLYRLAGEAGLTERDPDALALGRAPGEYRNAVLCERPNRDWGYTIARHFLYDTADGVRLEALAESSWKELADAAKLLQLEEKYHLDHSVTWFARLAQGPAEARQRFADGLSAALGDALAVFEPLPGEEALVSDGVLPSSNEEMLGEWLSRTGSRLEEVALDYVLERHASLGEMVPTGSGELSDQGEGFRSPGVAYRDGRWVH
ncbi:MAG TPA: 1,2-phenylacetyl-CoA epoxidase subunit PaaC, partial [Actinomycetota bacterium]|nr:1,2-phenylacetyl-CoA epoxidase subunit PaaC [Actinomycetota bacterium]